MKMKLTLFLSAMLFLTSCDNDEKPYKPHDGPDALPINDFSGKGIYKGIVVGSSGVIMLNIANNDQTISGTLVIDDKEIKLITENGYNEGFEGYLYGTMNTEDDVRIGFSASSSPGVINWDVFDVIIPGHPDIDIQVFKEYSTSQVKSFQGTFSGDATGIWNIVTSDPSSASRPGYWVAISKNNENNEVIISQGLVNLKSIFGGNDDITVTGTINGDNVEGTWTSKNDESSGIWVGERTL